MSERLPAPDSNRIRSTELRATDLTSLPAGTEVLRIHPLAGNHPTGWDEFRSWGPTNSRFDHQTRPVRNHPARAIMYLTVGPQAFTTALAEHFQDGAGAVGPIDRATRAPAATAFCLANDLEVLDLGSGWVTRAGGNQAISSGRRSRAQQWARAIYRHHTSIRGLIYQSSVWGPGTCIALWERAADVIPDTNELHRTLVDPVFDTPLAVAANDLGTILIP